jgi:hypothetical protein
MCGAPRDPTFAVRADAIKFVENSLDVGRCHDTALADEACFVSGGSPARKGLISSPAPVVDMGGSIIKPPRP